MFPFCLFENTWDDLGKLLKMITIFMSSIQCRAPIIRLCISICESLSAQRQSAGSDNAVSNGHPARRRRLLHARLSSTDSVYYEQPFALINNISLTIMLD
ncbi:hypothetical protein MAP00_009018 [Monascus purpureus]|nr:hypothetical protein MAP00_009018 [Monascus purpureus]